MFDESELNRFATDGSPLSREFEEIIARFAAGLSGGRPQVSVSDAATKVNSAIQVMLGMQRASWEQGIAAQALLEWDRACGNDLRGDIPLYALCHDAVVRQDSEGRLAVRLNQNDPGLLDPASMVEALLTLAKAIPEPSFEAAARKQIDYLLKEDTPRAADGTLSHRVDKVQLWVDGIYMGPPALAFAGIYWKDRALLTEAFKQAESYHNHLFDPEHHLYSHIWDCATEKWERKAFWGVGNGWALAGMARLLALLKQEGMKDEHDRVFSWILSCLEEVLLKHQRVDYLFHDVLDDPATFVEVNVAQQVAYTVFRLSKEGYPLPLEYIMRARDIRRAVHRRIDEHGIIRGVCGSPTFDTSGTATEGQAFFVLMEAAYLHTV